MMPSSAGSTGFECLLSAASSLAMLAVLALCSPKKFGPGRQPTPRPRRKLVKVLLQRIDASCTSSPTCRSSSFIIAAARLLPAALDARGEPFAPFPQWPKFPASDEHEGEALG